MTELARFSRTTVVVTALLLTVGACREASVPSGLGTQRLSISSDTVSGNGQLAELQQKRAAWAARGINDYRVQMQIVCFCRTDVTRPVLVEVRRGVVSKVWDLETAKLIANIEPYPSITALYDQAVDQRAGGGNVTAAYNAKLDFPVRLEIGTIANDAGRVFMLGAFTKL